MDTDATNPFTGDAWTGVGNAEWIVQAPCGVCVDGNGAEPSAWHMPAGTLDTCKASCSGFDNCTGFAYCGSGCVVYTSADEESPPGEEGTFSLSQAGPIASGSGFSHKPSFTCYTPHAGDQSGTPWNEQEVNQELARPAGGEMLRRYAASEHLTAYGRAAMMVGGSVAVTGPNEKASMRTPSVLGSHRPYN